MIRFLSIGEAGYCALGRGGAECARARLNKAASARPGGISGVCNDVACRIAKHAASFTLIFFSLRKVRKKNILAGYDVVLATRSGRKRPINAQVMLLLLGRGVLFVCGIVFTFAG